MSGQICVRSDSHASGVAVHVKPVGVVLPMPVANVKHVAAWCSVHDE